MACATPVVALSRGGAAETILDGVTGALVTESTADAFADGLDRVLRRPLDRHALRERALNFSPDRFTSTFRDLVAAALRAHEHAATL
jgi:glycosyltransferase involved in cell wall biosynthesis